jgi:transcriptional regulator with XRE-family HTH domain
MSTTLGTRIRDARQHARLTQEALAAQIGLEPSLTDQN